MGSHAAAIRRQLERAVGELLRKRGREFKIIDAGEEMVVLATKTVGYQIYTRENGTPVIDVKLRGEKGDVEIVAVVELPGPQFARALAAVVDISQEQPATTQEVKSDG